MQENSSATQYVNIEDFATIDQGAWFDATSKLNGEFAALCPSTFCTSGAYTTYIPLTFYCSVSSKEGSVKDCAWTFAATNAAVDASTAAIQFDVPTFQCHIHPKTIRDQARRQAARVVEPDALHEPSVRHDVPGRGLTVFSSIYDSLAADRFANPIGATPLGTTSSATPTYVDAADYYTTAANRAKWSAAYAELQSGFDNVCGDTFCSSDYADLWSMQLACAVTKSTGNIKACTWAFAGSFTTVATSGELALTSRSWQCPVAVKGTVSQMIAALTSTTDTNDGVHRVLPGGTDAYDSIAGCLP